MKNHQFAFVPTELPQIVAELTTTRFLDASNEQLPADELLKDLIKRTLVNYRSDASKEIALADLMVDDHQDARAFFKEHQSVERTQFYNLALQLLHFQTNEDFKLSDPITTWQQFQLPIYDGAKTTFEAEDVLRAWYLLLNTHTKFGQTLLDDLAANGYFAQFSDLKQPLIFNGKTQAVFNTDHLIREVVYVESDLDTDHDGKRDLLMAHVIRPAETEAGLKVSVLFTASPYDQGTNDIAGAQLTHNVDHPIAHKEPNQFSYSDVESHYQPGNLPAKRTGNGKTATHAEEHFQNGWGYTLNNYFLARGFAVVYSAGVGTKDSDGLRTTGDPAETLSATAIIEWLAGKRTAFTNRNGDVKITAWWSNHNVAMTGRSYLGTLQTAAATTGVAGLKTCISEAAISSWYDYYRENGLVVAPGGFQGEDADVLAEETFSREQRAGDYHRIKAKWDQQLAAITSHQDRRSGNYNQFWDARNYLKAVANIKADMVLVHGLNDWNVKPRNVYNLYQALKSVPVTTKLFLHQGQHIYINNFQSLDFTDMMNLWLSNKLLGIDNHANDLIPPVTIQDNVNPGTWQLPADWGTSHSKTIQLNDAKALQQPFDQATPAFLDQLSHEQLSQYTKHESSGQYDEWFNDLVNNPNSPIESTRLIFKTKPLDHPITIDGKVKVDLTMASDHNVGLVSAMLIDYGDAKRLNVSPSVLAPNAINAGYQWTKDSLKEFTLQANPSPSKMISIGHLNMQNRQNSYRVNELEPNQYYDLSFELQPTFYTLPAGRQLVLVIYATDLAMTVRGTMGVTYHLNTTQSSFTIPLLHNPD
ncbi:Xaa-Pro dipeptidyl-peptidase [Nicoliella spurrieriana]|uniref:Xaa-Pro dipeptidyl-peptidase n=1 Tax=Nicoliella spurrieriana TaxID=2925830 RepID=A0A976RR64_9LACO|nr:Xaa-Pro dipeptidyl-peptidase [Nicoliella spurrieriana]UQS86302.1 Xaa-Pro dipeptidyl-peptidase [Nicoliella spurrieriana]